MSKIVAIVGRPNVGKSTLFNRLIGERKAIVDDTSGVTRDRHYGIVDWAGREFTVVDTGGYVVGSDDIFEKAIRQQVEIAMVEADLILFMVDIATGITDEDEAFVKVLRKSTKPIVVVANKADNFDRLNEASQFYRFGFGDLFPISSISGSGSGELLDFVIEKLEMESQDDEEKLELPKFAIIGKPNVGKSTFLNLLVGEERNIVSDIPGTTRDSIHTIYNKFGKEFMLIDTAGLRKKTKVHEDIEFYSVMRTIRAVEDADVCFVLIDAQEVLDGLQAQDLNILRLAVKRKKGIVILVNKWDLIEKDTKTVDRLTKEIQEKLAPFNDVPILFVSALEKQRIHKALVIGLEVYENRRRKIPTSKLNDYMLEIIKRNPPPATRGLMVKIKYITQLPTHTPTFAFFANHEKAIREPYKRFLENKLREEFNFTGVPINIFIRQK